MKFTKFWHTPRFIITIIIIKRPQRNATEHKTNKQSEVHSSIPPDPHPHPLTQQEAGRQAAAAPLALGFPSPPGHQQQHGLRRRRWRWRGGCGGQVADGGDAGVPVLPGPVDAARDGAVGGHAGGGRRVRAPGRVHPRLLHRQLRARDLPPQPPHRLPLPHGRPGARPLRRRARPPHPRIRRVQALHQEAPRVQVLVCNHKGFCYSFCHDFLLRVRRPCLLAYTALLLDCTLCADDEAPDSAHGQVQICALQHREAEIRREEGWCEQQLVERLIPGVQGNNGRAGGRYSRTTRLIQCAT